MTHYAWTIEAKGRQPINKVTTAREMKDLLRILDLPGVSPPDWVLIEAGHDEHGRYTHNEGGDDEWSLKWTKLDDPR